MSKGLPLVVALKTTPAIARAYDVYDRASDVYKRAAAAMGRNRTYKVTNSSTYEIVVKTGTSEISDGR